MSTNQAPSTELSAAMLPGLSRVRVKDTHFSLQSEGRRTGVGKGIRREEIRECTAGQLPWQVDEVRITRAGVGVINAQGNTQEGKQDNKSAAGPPC